MLSAAGEEQEYDPAAQWTIAQSMLVDHRCFGGPTFFANPIDQVTDLGGPE